MAIFIGVHKIPAGLSESEIQAGWNNYKQEALKQGLKPLRVRYNMEKGVAYCETDAPHESSVWQAHKSVNVPLEAVIEVKASLE